MKFLHLGDIHIGKIVNEINMINDQKYILEEILRIAAEKKVDAVLIAGDIYDKTDPSEEAVKTLDWFLTKASEQNLTIIAISGNHDSAERLNFGTKLFESRNIFITGKYNGTVPYVTLSDEFGPVNFYMLPFVKASVVRAFHPELETDTYNSAIRSALSVAKINREERNVILAHQFVTSNYSNPLGAGSENTAPEFVGTLEKVDHSAFDEFDYVALGHIHRPQQIGRKESRYSGSPLKYSLSEVNSEKSVPLVTMNEKGNVSVECIPLVPLHDMRHIKGKFADILDKNHVERSKDYIYVTLTDEETIPNAVDAIRYYYPNVMNLNYDNNHTKLIEGFDAGQASEKQSFEDLISGFYMQQFGTEISDEEWKILKESAREAGIKDEAD